MNKIFNSDLDRAHSMLYFGFFIFFTVVYLVVFDALIDLVTHDKFNFMPGYLLFIMVAGGFALFSMFESIVILLRFFERSKNWIWAEESITQPASITSQKKENSNYK